MTDTRELIPLVPVARPDGRIYRPRKIVACRWDNDGYNDMDCGVVVLGTHNVEAAAEEADRCVKYFFDNDLVAGSPIIGWYRDGYNEQGPAWICDDVKGRAGVMFTARYPEDLKKQS